MTVFQSLSQEEPELPVVRPSLTEWTSTIPSLTLGMHPLFRWRGTTVIGDLQTIYKLSDRSGLAAASLSNVSFFGGGYTGVIATQVVDIYDGSLWKVANLSRPRTDLNAVAIQSQQLVIFAGGGTPSLSLPRVDLFNYALDSQTIANLCNLSIDSSMIEIDLIPRQLWLEKLWALQQLETWQVARDRFLDLVLKLKSGSVCWRTRKGKPSGHLLCKQQHLDHCHYFGSKIFHRWHFSWKSLPLCWRNR